MTDQQIVQAAEGYNALGLYDEALQEISRLSPSTQAISVIRHFKVGTLMKLDRWADALQEMGGVSACETGQWEDGELINAAICLHKLGYTGEAKRIHCLCSPQSHQNALYHYNLACYEAQLDKITDASASLQRALDLDATFQTIAHDDPDLIPLRHLLQT